MVKRKDVVLGLKSVLEEQEYVYAAWEGGSAATKKLDEYSDLDVMIVCKDDFVEEVLSLLDDHLEYTYGVKRKYRVPEPTWHGFSQVFYQIKGSEPLFYLDLAVIKESIPDKFTDVSRHGEGVFWFLKKDIFAEKNEQIEDVIERCKVFYKRATESDFLLILETQKAIARGVFVEAFPMYYGFIVRHLAVLLNLKHRKEKVDFNLRYLSRDYDAEDVDLVDKALKVSSMDEMEELFTKLLDYYEELKESMFELYG
mgnify:CR=1 FL=1